MKLRTRILTLLGVGLAGFCAALAALHQVQGQSVRSVLKELTWEKQQLLRRVADVTGDSLRQLSRDYTQWTEMCEFIAHPTPEWAKVNIDASLETWKFHAAWLFNADGQPVYGTNRLNDDALKTCPLDQVTLVARLRAKPFQRFFLETRHGILEIATAPIQPSEDNDRSTPPKGWMVVGKLWDDAQLHTIAELAGGELTWQPAGEAPVRGDSQTVRARLTLEDWNGEPLRALQLTALPLLAPLVDDTDREEWLLFVVFGLTSLLSLAWSLHNWVVLPLERISESLATNSPEPIAPLLRQKDEMGGVAQLFATSLRRKQELQSEIEERWRIEKALREALEERAQLGRDLHDQTIQSIYAAGLRLEGATQLMASNPRAAEKQLAETVVSLNEIITELRHVIAGTNPKETASLSLKRGLQRIADNARSVSPVICTVEVDDAASQTLAQDERTELIAIAREAVSNALRHSAARTIHLRFYAKLPERRLEISDDGKGFSPAALPERGHGLDNMTRRAEEIGAVLEIDSAPGRGTRLRVELPDLANHLG